MLAFLEETIRSAGKVCLESSPEARKKDVTFKGEKDLVTHIDKKVEALIIERIKRQYPDHSILGEETGFYERNSPYCWIIDPIDGTTSFFHDQPFYAVSIGVKKKGETICGAVFAPRLDELFLAEKGGGASMNHSAISISGTTELKNAVLATGFACLRDKKTLNNLAFFNQIVPCIRDIRRYGSAAIDLCYVACGRIDGFWEMNLNEYDIAAGALIVTEAGGMVCDFKGMDRFPEDGILAGRREMIQNLLPFF